LGAKVQVQTQEMEVVPLGAVKLHPRNPRKGDLRAVRQSIERNGFVGALVANRRTGHILAGNHRYMAARELGLKEIPVIWVDVPAAREVKILLADNRASDLGSYDKRDLAALLQEVALEGDLLSTLYTQVDLQDLLGPPGEDEVDDPEEEWVGMPEYESEDLRPHRQILVSFADEAAVARFGALLEIPLTEKTKATWFPHREPGRFAHLAYVDAREDG
jgi:hypothetical protein